MIRYSTQNIDQSDIDAVVDALRSGWLTQGPAVEQFEREVAAYCGARHAVAVSSGTAALHVACLSLEFGVGDLLWTSPNTFVASANCALLCGGDVDFVDIDPNTYNLCPDALEQKLEAAESTGQLPTVVMPVHFSGRACDMARIQGLAQRYGFKVIEDASHALGGRTEERRIGACDRSDVAVFSLHAIKSITTGEGGLLLTNTDYTAERARMLRSHGIKRDLAAHDTEAIDPWRYEQPLLGLNYRMTELQAALGLSQLSRLDGFIERRRDLARRYAERFANLPLDTPVSDDGDVSAWHLYPVRFHGGADIRRRVFEYLRKHGIESQVHYYPVHLQPLYRQRGHQPGDFPAAEAYYENVLSLPLHPGLTDSEQDQVVEVLTSFLSAEC